jgi:formylglycine-generating enzyme required for sulfatase activity
MVLFAIDGTAEVRAEAARIAKDFYPAGGLDAGAAEKLLAQFDARLKYFVAPDSPVLQGGKNVGPQHYCMPASASAVTGVVRERDGKRWIVAHRIEPCKLRYPSEFLAPDKPFLRTTREPSVLKVADRLTLKCMPIPAGTFLMGSPYWMWPYHVEEFPHRVTLTRDYYLSEIPVTQEMFEAVIGRNPSTVKDPQMPVQNPRFADLERFCALLSQKNARKVRLPTSAEWEYAARVGASNPGFAEKYEDQNSTDGGSRSPLKVKSKKPNAWGLYDVASCWWEITGDKASYHVRKSVVDPFLSPGVENARSQRTGRGLVNDRWSICTHEFITESGGYAGQKFRVVVEADNPAQR